MTKRIKATSGKASVFPMKGSNKFVSLGVVLGDGKAIAVTEFCHAHATNAEWANAALVASAFNSATRCEEMGMDGRECVERVADLIQALSNVLYTWDKFGPKNLTTLSGKPTRIDSARELLSQLKAKD